MKRVKPRSAAIIIRNDQVLLIKREKSQSVYFVLPGGTIEDGESPEEACIREAYEETNLRIEIRRKLIEISNKGRIEYSYLCSPVSKEMKINEPKASRINENNKYSLEWKPIQSLGKLNFKPAKILPTIEQLPKGSPLSKQHKTLL